MQNLSSVNSTADHYWSNLSHSATTEAKFV